MYKLKLMAFCASMLCFFNATNAQNAGQNFYRFEYGKIKEIAISGPSFPNKDYISLSGQTPSITDPISCYKFPGTNDTLYRVRDDAKGNRMMAAAIMAKAANLTINIGVGWNSKDSEGVCFADLLVVDPGFIYTNSTNRVVSGGNTDKPSVQLPPYEEAFK